MRTYKQQLADVLRTTEHKGWTGQLTQRGYPSPDRAEVVAELFGPHGEVKTVYLRRPDGTLAMGR